MESSTNISSKRGRSLKIPYSIDLQDEQKTAG
jgi:hypothetical protein